MVRVPVGATAPTAVHEKVRGILAKILAAGARLRCRAQPPLAPPPPPPPVIVRIMAQIIRAVLIRNII